MTNKPKYGKAVTRKETDTITSNCDKVIAFLQSVVVKLHRLLATPLSLCDDKRGSDWFRQRFSHYHNFLTIPPTTAPQYHSGIMGVLSSKLRNLLLSCCSAE